MKAINNRKKVIVSGGNSLIPFPTRILLGIILNQKGVRDVIISFDEDDGVKTWTGSNEEGIDQAFQMKYPQ